MRFASIAAGIAAALAVPLAVAAAAPDMSSQEFLSAVRCAAYVQASAPRALGAQRMRLNGEARKHSVEIAFEARAEASAIARRAAAAQSVQDAAMVRHERTAACRSPA